MGLQSININLSRYSVRSFRIKHSFSFSSWNSFGVFQRRYSRWCRRMRRRYLRIASSTSVYRSSASSCLSTSSSCLPKRSIPLLRRSTNSTHVWLSASQRRATSRTFWLPTGFITSLKRVKLCPNRSAWISQSSGMWSNSASVVASKAIVRASSISEGVGFPSNASSLALNGPLRLPDPLRLTMSGHPPVPVRHYGLLVASQSRCCRADSWHLSAKHWSLAAFDEHFLKISQHFCQIIRNEVQNGLAGRQVTR